ncbi:DgyrCDS9393 [Dimorphilus gyrociliatus]|nr:DgyrCDS9393 [Dimorphilus gyrociliatus]
MPRITTKIRAKSSETLQNDRWATLRSASKGKSAALDGFGRLDVGSSKPRTVKCNTFEDIANLIARGQATNIVVVIGAGVSTASGIPDFRSPKTGLYYNLQKFNIPYPEAIFDMDYFRTNPRPFYTLAKDLYPSVKHKPNSVHYFIRLLHEKHLLHRVYTQNIDGLEKLSGIPNSKLVEAHGTFETASCTRCRSPQSPGDVKDSIFSNKIPRCSNRRCNGLVKPDVVFFGEDLTSKFYSYVSDMKFADLVLIMGTSLQVEPFSNIIDRAKFFVPRCLFNKKAVGPFAKKGRLNDVFVGGDLIDTVAQLAAKLDWTDELSRNTIQWESEFEDRLQQYGFMKRIAVRPRPPRSIRRLPKPPPDTPETTTSSEAETESQSSNSSGSTPVLRSSKRRHDVIIKNIIDKFEKTSIK